MTKAFLFFFMILSLPFSLFSQDEKIAAFIKEGINLHDKGKYNEAIQAYKKALKIDKKHALTHYEIGLSYYHLKAYKKTIKSINKALKYGKDERILLSAYLIKGAAIDDGGNTKKAIKVYEKAIKKHPKSYLLHYNASFSYYKINKYAASKAAIKKALELNPTHNSSNLLLAYINSEQGLRVQALMAVSKFLFLENLSHPVNISARAKRAFELYKKLALGNIKSKGNQINISLMLNEADEFSSLNLMMSLMQATNQQLADSLNFSELEQLNFFMQTMCQSISTSEVKDGFWGKQYVQFYKKIEEKKLVEAFSNMVLLSTKDESVISWINKNADKIEELEQLFREHHELK